LKIIPRKKSHLDGFKYICFILYLLKDIGSVGMYLKLSYKNSGFGQTLHLIPIILVAWESEIRRIAIPGQPGQKAYKTPI
jgi:hypothetical protein